MLFCLDDGRAFLFDFSKFIFVKFLLFVSYAYSLAHFQKLIQ